MIEEFKKIEGFENYAVSRQGNVMNIKSNKQLKGILLKTGYIRVTLNNRKQLTIHRLVAKAFIPNPDNLPHVNHIDENPANNDISNLEWCTHKRNIQHSCKSTKSYLYKDKNYYRTNPSTRSDFKTICGRHEWDFNSFTEEDSGIKRYSNRKYYYKEKNMDYVEKIENKIAEFKNGKINKQDLGVSVESIVSDESLSMGEMIAIEEELNPLGTSMYEEKYNELQGEIG